jgi:hypothetical protein
MCNGHGYNSWYWQQVKKHLPKTKLQRLNKAHGVATARRGRMDDDDPRKNGVALERVRMLEAKIKAEQEV